MDFEKTWSGWVKRESGSSGFRQVCGDNGHAYGKYQFDYRYGLVPAMTYFRNASGHYGGFSKYIKLGAGNSELSGNKELANLWISYCNKYPEEFETLQDEAGYIQYYTPAKEYLTKNGYDITNYSEVLKGSLWSFSIRSGAETGAKKLLDGFKKGLTDEIALLKYAYGTYGNNDANRWTEENQLGDALARLAELGIKEVIYRVGTSWDSKTKTVVGQTGAYSVLDNAIKACGDSIRYKVFDENGNVVYPEQKEEETTTTTTEEVKEETPVEKEEVKITETTTAKDETTTDNISATTTEELPDTNNEYKVGLSYSTKKKKVTGQIGAYSKYENAKAFASERAVTDNKTYYVFNKKGTKLFMAQPFTPYNIKTIQSITVYSQPSFDSITVGVDTGIGVFGIVAESTDSKGIKWGKLKSGIGWIPLTNTIKK
jgi:hypothetical protein